MHEWNIIKVFVTKQRMINLISDAIRLVRL
jgi:hypothetical protein